MLGGAAPNTYIPTWEGWVYLATVIDCCSKEVIGWATDDNYKTRHYSGPNAELMFH